MLLKEIETVKADKEDSDAIIDLKPVRGFEDLLHQYEAVADVWHLQVKAVVNPWKFEVWFFKILAN